MSDDFYIGYDTPVPRRWRSRVYGAVAAAAIVGLLVIVAVRHHARPFADSSFAFGDVQSYRGRVVATPYPTLIFNRAAEAGPGFARLIGQGKHGATPEAAPFDGQTVEVQGTRIARGRNEAIEIVPGTFTAASPDAPPPPAEADLGPLTLRGEIVDGKCYLGVMNPGQGATHRDCAVACIRGGLPPLFATPMDDGTVYVFTLASTDRRPVNDAVADLVGRYVEIRGRGVQRGDEMLLLADPATYRLLRQP